MQSGNKCIKIFVYGSMKEGFSAHDEMLGDAEFLSKCLTLKKYKMFPSFDYAYPYLFDLEGGYHIAGELYSINEALVRKLDEYEGVSHGYYIAKNIDIITSDGSEEKALAYISATSPNPDFCDMNFPLSDWTKGHEECWRKVLEYCQ